MNSLVFLALFLPSAALAQSRPFLWEVPELDPAAGWAYGISARQFVHEYFADEDGSVLFQTAPDGSARSLKGLALELSVLRREAGGSVWTFTAPYMNTEFSPHDPGRRLPYSVDDPFASRGDGLGDLRFSLSRPLWRRGEAAAFGAAELSVPTGLSPFASQHPLLATGNGEFKGGLTLGVIGRRDGETFWVAAGVEAGSGHGADMAQGVFLSFTETAPYTRGLAGGRAWVSRDPSMKLGAGLSWEWHREGAKRHCLGVEMRAWRQAPLEMDGTPVEGSSVSAVDIIPRAIFDFGGFSFSAAWDMKLAPALQALGRYADVLLRAEFSL